MKAKISKKIDKLYKTKIYSKAKAPLLANHFEEFEAKYHSVNPID